MSNLLDKVLLAHRDGQPKTLSDLTSATEILNRRDLINAVKDLNELGRVKTVGTNQSLITETGLGHLKNLETRAPYQDA